MSELRFASALSVLPETPAAEVEAVAALEQSLGGATPELLVLFITHHHGGALDGLGRRLMQATGAKRLLGCTGETVIGGSREVEEGPALALWALAGDGVWIEPFRVGARADEEGEVQFSGLPPAEFAEEGTLLMLGDPFSFPMGQYLEQLNEHYPGRPVIGGMASGGRGPGQNLLFQDGETLAWGAVGLWLGGSVEVVPVVSQGCRPIHEPYVITKIQDHVIRKLGGKTAAHVLQKAFQSLESRDAALLQRAPFLGVAVDATKSTFQRGDFLVRGIMGIEKREGGIAIADNSLRAGQTVQFMVRDAQSASEDLDQLLAAQASEGEVGVLLFSCNGRGTRMFPVADHDASRVQARYGREVPAAGFFAMGEIGPVGGRNFLHGFTASLAIVRAKRD
ncbi:MAG: FIST C-terminal domain-containing protein [Planctomycetes bacterium]|nr:FIST C-terminal domain-containing protein [Planctomycetota bacterium]